MAAFRPVMGPRPPIHRPINIPRGHVLPRQIPARPTRAHPVEGLPLPPRSSHPVRGPVRPIRPHPMPHPGLPRGISHPVPGRPGLTPRPMPIPAPRPPDGIYGPGPMPGPIMDGNGFPGLAPLPIPGDGGGVHTIEPWLVPSPRPRPQPQPRWEGVLNPDALRPTSAISPDIMQALIARLMGGRFGIS